MKWLSFYALIIWSTLLSAQSPQAPVVDSEFCKNSFAKLVGPPRFHTEYIVKKYNTEKVVSFQFTPQTLDRLSDYYHEQKVPTFLWRHVRGIFHEGEVYLRRTTDQRFVFALNDPYYDANQLIQLKDNGKLHELKNSKKGLVFLAWYAHPKMPEKDLNDAFKISKIEEKSEKFLASLLDLRQSDLPSLKRLKAETTKVLEEDFGVNGTDDIKLYFHFPYMKDTLGLHLHIRVNHPAHELETGKSFLLDEVIEHLEKEGDIQKLILKRQKEKGGIIMNSGGVAHTLKEMGVPVNEVPNPYFDPYMQTIKE